MIPASAVDFHHPVYEVRFGPALSGADFSAGLPAAPVVADPVQAGGAGGADQAADRVSAGRAADSRRAELARAAYAGGWLFLAIALFCFAQSSLAALFSSLGRRQPIRWRLARVHP